MEQSKFSYIGTRLLSGQQFELLKKELKSASPYHQIILDDLSKFSYFKFEELEDIFNSLCVRLLDKDLLLIDFNDKMENYHAVYMLQTPIVEDDQEYVYIDCYRSISNGVSLDIIRLLTKGQLSEMSFPSWQHFPFILGEDPAIILVKGDSLNSKLEKDLLEIKDFNKLIPVITSVLSEHQCKRIMDSPVFKELTDGKYIL